MEDVISSHVVKFSNYGCRNLRLYFSFAKLAIEAIAIPLRLITEDTYWFHYEFLIVQVLSNASIHKFVPGNIIIFRFFYFDQISINDVNIFNSSCKLTTENSPWIFDCGINANDVLKSKWVR
jgi:hypothetical protein